MKDKGLYHGVGVFVTQEEIQKDIIEDAFTNLKNDPDIYIKKIKKWIWVR